MERRPRFLLVLTVCLWVTLPSSAYANMLIPVVACVWPQMLVMLLPVIVIEAAVIGHRLRMPLRALLSHSALANIVSTIVGIPVTWVVLTLIEYVPLFALDSWVQREGIALPVTPGQLLEIAVVGQTQSLGVWTWIVSTIVLCAVFLVASWLIEYGILRRRLSDQPRQDVRRAVLLANLVTYAVLLMMVVTWSTAMYVIYG